MFEPVNMTPRSSPDGSSVYAVHLSGDQFPHHILTSHSPRFLPQSEAANAPQICLQLVALLMISGGDYVHLAEDYLLFHDPLPGLDGHGGCGPL